MAIRISTAGLKELQARMKRMEVALEPKDLNPILAGALKIFGDKYLSLLRTLTKRAQNLPSGWEHIEDAFAVKEGKSDRSASAFAKVFRKAAPQAIWIEWGHRIVGHKPNKKDTGKTVVAFPAFRTALDTTKASVKKAIDEGIGKAVFDSAK